PSVLHGWLVAIPASAANVNGAIDLIMWAAGPESGLKARYPGVPPARKDQWDAIKRLAVDAAKPLPRLIGWLTVEQAIQKKLQDIESGKISPAEALRAADREIGR